MKKYVLGFMFDETYPNTVVLIRKSKPDWQRGCLNGVGGKIEEGETSAMAMCREFAEETGLQTYSWRLFATIFDAQFFVDCYFTDGDTEKCRTTTDEEVIVIDRAYLSAHRHIDNVPWLIDMALSFRDRDPGATHYRIEYVRRGSDDLTIPETGQETA